MTNQASRSTWRRRGLVLVAICAATVAAAAAVLALVPRNDEVGDVDAVIVLGGSGMERLELGVALATERDAPLVLSAEGIDRGAAAGLTCDVEVVCVNPEPATTAGEALTMHELAAERGWDRVAVATSDFHTNRSRALFRQCFGDRVDVVGADTPTTVRGEIYRSTRELVGHVAGRTLRRAC